MSCSSHKTKRSDGRSYMNNKMQLIKVPGLGPTSIRGESLFDVLWSESDQIPDAAQGIMRGLRDILAYGGEKLELKLEQNIEGRENAEGSDTPPSPVFNVLSFDVATIFPADVSNDDSLTETIAGQQICLCRSSGDSDVENTWYRRALKEYFRTPPGGSLLAFPGIQQHLGRFYILRPNHIKAAVGSYGAKAELDTDFIWKEKFDPAPAALPGAEFRQRFDQFGEAVFDELLQVQAGIETASSVILWIYVGPLELPTRKQRPLWGVSLFSVIKPTEPYKGTGHWMNDSRLVRRLLRSVRQLYFHLALAAYRAMERRKLIRDKSEFQINIAQSVAHEFKNLTQNISSLGSLLYQEFFSAIREVDRELGASTVKEKLAGPLSRLKRLSALSRLTSAISLATYWLTTPTARSQINFIPDPDCRVFRAAVHLALDLLKDVRSNWRILDHDMKDVFDTLGPFYGSSDLDVLVQRIDVALMLFVISEPVRNLRSKNSSRKEVIIRTRVEGQSLFICQTTYEEIMPDETEESPATHRLNKLLRAGSNMTGRFVALDKPVQLVSRNIQLDGYYEVVRETHFHIVGVPREVKADERT